MLTYSAAENLLCAPEDWVSGACFNEKIVVAYAVILHAFAALSVVAVGLATYFTAPSHRRSVVWVALVTGVAVATYMAVQTKAWSVLFVVVGCAVLVGCAKSFDR